MKANREQWEAELQEMKRRLPRIRVQMNPVSWMLVITALQVEMHNPNRPVESREGMQKMAMDLIKMFPADMVHIHAKFKEGWV